MMSLPRREGSSEVAAGRAAVGQPASTAGDARRRDRDDGMSMVEVLIAAFLVAVALAAVASTATATMLSISSSRLRQQAIAIATSSIEASRGYDAYTDVATRPTDPLHSATFDPDGPGPMTAEPTVATATGMVTGPVHHGIGSGLAWQTAVTWYDDPTIATAENAKRVTAIVTWQLGDQTFEVRESTVISSVERTYP